MNVLIAPDSFKGCLTSSEVCAAIEKGIKEYDENIDVMQFPSSDGGEGFCDCMRNIYGGMPVNRKVTYPMGDRGNASFVYNEITETAFIELASASGLILVPACKRNILKASTLGTGELIKEAIDLGAKNIIIGLGGSATNDCGIGILYALGMRFFDSSGTELEPIASSLDKVAFVNKNGMTDMSGITVTAACDVKNPLCGADGAAEVFSRQKGATEDEVEYLDKAALHFARVLGIDPDVQGSGAAGGVGAAVISVLGGTYKSGASLLVCSEKFKYALSRADLLITGEGNTDEQTAYGKLVCVVASSAKRSGVKTVVLSGGLSDGYEALREYGADSFYSLLENDLSLEYCMTHARGLLTEKTAMIMKNLCQRASE